MKIYADFTHNQQPKYGKEWARLTNRDWTCAPTLTDSPLIRTLRGQIEISLDIEDSPSGKVLVTRAANEVIFTSRIK